MAEYVDKEIVKEAIEMIANACLANPRITRGEIQTFFKGIPIADVRPVVTCAECDWHVDCGYHFCNKWCQPCPDNADFYCAYGERQNCGAKMEGNE